MSFDPVTLGYVSALLAAYQGVTSYNQGKRQERTAEQNADIARKQAAAKEEQIRRHNRLLLGKQRAAAAQSGFDPNTGSLLELQADSAQQLELDSLVTRYEGTMQALSFESEADQAARRARAGLVSGLANASGSLLGAYGGRYGRQPGFAGTQAQAPVEDRSFRGS